jgi:hypothetical protein
VCCHSSLSFIILSQVSTELVEVSKDDERVLLSCKFTLRLSGNIELVQKRKDDLNGVIFLRKNDGDWVTIKEWRWLDMNLYEPSCITTIFLPLCHTLERPVILSAIYMMQTVHKPVQLFKVRKNIWLVHCFFS